MTTFNDLELDPKVLQAVAETGYETPTPIQAEAIPHALQGRDVLGIAQTGTGKTASFTLPMITMLAKGRARARMPRSLVLAPTRELAAQVAENFEAYAKYSKLSMALLIGGVSFKDQDRLIDRGVDVLIATPGRLLDHFERGKLMLTGVQIMVIDEADRMLDMGFIPDIERIFKLTPFTRQTLFFSATMAPEITRITQEFLHNPVRVEVARQATTSETIEQGVCMVTPSRKDRGPKEKRDTLRALVEKEGDTLTNAIIFCNRKRDVDIVAKSLKKHGMDAAPIHGDLDQSVRTRILTSFRDGELKLLVASDVAARGLDIPSVSHVYNFDVPIHAEDYVHRIGRTGRAGRDGKAITLVTPADEKYLAAIEDLVKKQIPRIDNPLGNKSGAPEGGAKANDEPRGAKSDKPRRERRVRKKTPAVEGTGEQPATVAPDVAAEVVAEPPAPRKNSRSQNERKSRGGRNNRRDNARGGVVGMGDHVPAFILRDLRALQEEANARDEARAAKRAAKQAVEAEGETAADTDSPAPQAETKKPRRRRVKKDDAAPQEVLAEDAVSVVIEEPETAPETASETAPEGADSADSKPARKPRRRRAPKAEAAAPAETDSESPDTAQSATPDAEAPAKKPRKRRAPRKTKTEDTAAAETTPPETPAEPAPETPADDSEG